MKLTKEQVQRIDSFLQGIGADYIDIRLEMVDHIASEIEEKVEDVEEFFDNKKFQTHFVKYMLSRKDKLIDQYNKQEKRLTWFCLILIFKDFLKQLARIQNLNLIALISVLCFIVGPNFLKATTIIMLCLLFGLLFFGAKRTSLFYKKYKDVKIIRTYMALISFIIIIPMQFTNYIDILYKGNYNLNTIYMYYISFVLGYLLNQSFLSKKREIENKYQFLIN
ncbi:hypothetical protein [Tenacibaculum crassostreae]|uniref:hypothetical protein n=1 Tax=Tenacibaculum crassostreae TaxID=502683 RepID=UPI0038959BB1